MADPNIICSRPECQTTAGCQCVQGNYYTQPHTSPMNIDQKRCRGCYNTVEEWWSYCASCGNHIALYGTCT